MWFCKNFCNILVKNCCKKVEKWKLNKEFLQVYGTKCIEVSEDSLKKYCRKGNIYVVEWLENKGIDISYDDHNASYWTKSSLEIVKRFIKKGADINVAINWACNNGNLEVVKYLFEQGADVNYDGSHSIPNACAGGHIEVLKYLTQKGVKIVSDGYLLSLVSKKGHLNVLKFLVDNGADVTSEDSLAVCSASRSGCLEVVKYLVQNGADASSLAVQNASGNGHLAVVKFLVENGADITDESLYLACENGRLEVVKFLFKNGIFVIDNNNLAFCAALDNGHWDVVEFLKTD